MAAGHAETLENLKTARDAIITAIATGELPVQITVRGRTKIVEEPTLALERLERLIATYSRKVNQTGTSPYRLVKIGGISPPG